MCGCVCTTVHEWRSDDDFIKWLLSLHFYVGSRGHTQVFRLTWQASCPPRCWLPFLIFKCMKVKCHNLRRIRISFHYFLKSLHCGGSWAFVSPDPSSNPYFLLKGHDGVWSVINCISSLLERTSANILVNKMLVLYVCTRILSIILHMKAILSIVFHPSKSSEVHSWMTF